MHPIFLTFSPLFAFPPIRTCSKALKCYYEIENEYHRENWNTILILILHNISKLPLDKVCLFACCLTLSRFLAFSLSRFYALALTFSVCHFVIGCHCARR